MILINLGNLLLLFIGILAIWGILPQDYREEIGGIVGLLLVIAWVITWIIIFPVLGHSIYFK